MSTRDNGSAKASSKTLPDIIRPYGDTTGDAMVQVSFTLPIPHDKRAEGAALQLAAKMGLAPALLAFAQDGFCYDQSLSAEVERRLRT